MKVKKYSKNDMRLAFWLIIPAFVAISITAFIPLIQTIYDSFFSWSLRPGFQREFLGLENYIKMFQDARFLNSLWNTIYFTVLSVLLEFLIGLGVALLMNAKFKGRGFMRAAMLIPWAVPTVISSQMWRWMYNDNYGVISNLFYNLGKQHLL
jgi:multiple sugar transport system permease protein